MEEMETEMQNLRNVKVTADKLEVDKLSLEKENLELKSKSENSQKTIEIMEVQIEAVKSEKDQVFAVDILFPSTFVNKLMRTL